MMLHTLEICCMLSFPSDIQRKPGGEKSAYNLMHLHLLFRDQRLLIFKYTPIVIYCFQNHADEKADNAWYKSLLNWHWPEL